jgi:hypothetical protein
MHFLLSHRVNEFIAGLLFNNKIIYFNPSILWIENLSPGNLLCLEFVRSRKNCRKLRRSMIQALQFKKIEKSGFKPEARFEKTIFKNGEFYELIYAFYRTDNNYED